MPIAVIQSLIELVGAGTSGGSQSSGQQTSAMGNRFHMHDGSSAVNLILSVSPSPKATVADGPPGSKLTGNSVQQLVAE